MKGKDVSTLMTILGTVGVIATAVLTAKATPKALEAIAVTEWDKGEELTKIEKVKASAPAYIPAVMVGAATIACILGANILNKKQQTSIATSYALLDQAYKEYRAKVKEQLGDEKEAEIEKAVEEEQFESMDIPKDIQLFYDMYTNTYFESTIEPTRMDDGLECFIVDMTPI